LTILTSENSIIIVVDQKGKAEMEAVTKLQISEWGKCSPVLWNVRQYKDNEQRIGSNQKVIVVGQNEISERNVASIHWKCDELGMRYGWCGNSALLQVVPQTFGTKDWVELRKLCNYNLTPFFPFSVTLASTPRSLDADIQAKIDEIQRLYMKPLQVPSWALSFTITASAPLFYPPNPNDKAVGTFFFGKPKVWAKVLGVQYAYLACKLFADCKEFWR
jgi:hypothetical protein